jgi:hypothetical protein
LGDDENGFLAEGLLRKKATYGSVRYRDAEITVRAAFRTASSEMHRETVAILLTPTPRW